LGGTGGTSYNNGWVERAQFNWSRKRRTAGGF
jgi:hypothetical protein